MSRSTEEDIAKAVIRYLDTLPNKEDKVRNIIYNLPNHISLTTEDTKESKTREGEEVWEQQVRNIICHRGEDGNAITDKRLSYPGRATLKKL
ncbi:hypothetical protein [Gluconobacter japonicus]|uniref:Uncharacterized protein n=1 Tax=Gluconobacter japonicus TaxID=376620 RepID=A0ABQ5WG25_GLUJA|nr:hypothetical protein [Gluconobacter japonicus]KXV20423.1 hypothetical protein AD935_12030 [Gluconobacter japonicus]KXV27985.1 hypothetical protein AD938_05665 [Gluconobacter japonicus]GBR23328.1 hypothetical protein AA3271_1487 [Gluconobacter japonicus NBRC 3271]GLQ58833.1 hypothetical protein GCM10010937_06360 [Gluconobacter japonicus]